RLYSRFHSASTCVHEGLARERELSHRFSHRSQSGNGSSTNMNQSHNAASDETSSQHPLHHTLTRAIDRTAEVVAQAEWTGWGSAPPSEELLTRIRLQWRSASVDEPPAHVPGGDGESSDAEPADLIAAINELLERIG